MHKLKHPIFKSSVNSFNMQICSFVAIRYIHDLCTKAPDSCKGDMRIHAVEGMKEVKLMQFSGYNEYQFL